MVHKGSWGLPDFGLTELAGRILGEKTTDQGGSDLNRSWAQNNSVNAPTIGSIAPPQQQGPSQITTQPNTGGSILGATPQQSIPQLPQQQNVPSNNDVMGQINEMYNPAMGVLNQREALLPGQKATALEQLNNQSTEFNALLDQQRLSSTQEVDRQRQATFEGKRSALGDALRTYNALQQQTQSRFGRGTGAGQFVSEIQGQEYLRGRGQINQGYQQSMQKLGDYMIQVDSSIQNEVRRIERERMTGVKAIEDEMNTRLVNISGDKAMLEQAKSQQKVELLRESIQAQRQLKQAYDQALFDTQAWRANQEQSIQASAKQIQDQWQQTLQNSQDDRQLATTAPAFSQFGGGTTQDPQIAQRTPFNLYSTNQPQNEEDPGSIFSPDQYFT